MATERDGEGGGMRRRSLRFVSVYGWLLGLYPVVQAVVGGDYRPVWPAAGTLLLFVALYAATFTPLYRREDAAGPRAPLLVAFAALAFAAVLGFGGIWLLLLLYLSAACGVFVPPRWNVLTVGAVTAAAGLLASWQGETVGYAVGFLTGSFAVGMLNVYLARMREAIRALREARAELALVAVAEERLRFARDLHDLLGHTLSLVVVKAEAVRRLAERGDSAAAAGQAADIEAVGRRALAEVREAVSGYRGRSLAVALDGARAALADAGIAVRVQPCGAPLPAEVDALLGRAVREAATNVIRHSKASHCAIVVRRSGDEAFLEVRDDGAGTNGAGVGSGLAGLAEQVAGAGGRFRAGPRGDGGFELVVAVPAGRAAAEAEGGAR